MPRPPQPFKPRVCVVCGITFTPHSTRAKTCSPACSAEYHRNFCLEKAREAAFLRPYDIEAYLAKHPELNPNHTPEPRATQHPSHRKHPKQNHQHTTPPDPHRNPEPRSDSQRDSQRQSVIATMSLPPSQRYQFSRLWSDFQRSVAIAIEQQRLDPAIF